MYFTSPLKPDSLEPLLHLENQYRAAGLPRGKSAAEDGDSWTDTDAANPMIRRPFFVDFEALRRAKRERNWVWGTNTQVGWFLSPTKQNVKRSAGSKSPDTRRHRLENRK
jgi:hypothetical protein